MRVLHYLRKPRATGNFSLEFVFSDVRSRLASVCEISARIAPCLSNGLVPRLRILVDIWRSQSSVTHVTGDINFAVLAVRRRAAILTVLDCGFLRDKSTISRLILKLFWLHLPVHHSAVVTTISEFVKSEIVNATGCKPSKVRVIYCPISERFQRRDREFNQSCPSVLIVGTAPNKNIERIIKACSAIQCKLVVLGALSGSQRLALAESGLAYANRVALSIDETVALYEESDIVCYASIYEGFGMPIVEANTVGRPVVTSNVASMPEIATDAACIVDPFDVDSIREGIHRVINDSEYRNALILRGFENCKRFSSTSIAQQYLAVYEEVYSSF